MMFHPRTMVAALAAVVVAFPWSKAHARSECNSSATGCLSCDLVAYFDFDDCAGEAMFNNSAPNAVQGASATLTQWYVQSNWSDVSQAAVPTPNRLRCPPHTVAAGFREKELDGVVAIRSGGGIKIDLLKDASLPMQIKNYTILLDVQAPPEKYLYATSNSSFFGNPNPIVSLIHLGRNPHSRSALAWARWSSFPFRFNPSNQAQITQAQDVYEPDKGYNSSSRCCPSLSDLVSAIVFHALC